MVSMSRKTGFGSVYVRDSIDSQCVFIGLKVEFVRFEMPFRRGVLASRAPKFWLSHWDPVGTTLNGKRLDNGRMEFTS